MKGAAACTVLLATLLCGHAAPGDPVLPQMPLQQPAQPVQPVQPVQQPPQLPVQPPMVPVQPVPVAPKPVKPVPVVPVVPPPVIPMKNWLLPNGNIDFRRLPPWTRCVQNVIPPGVKPGACMQVMCMPKTVQPGDVFHIRVRFCMQRPRRWHLTFGLLDQETKEFYGGAGAGIVDTKTQCAEVTFEHPFDAGETPAGGFDLMWKFFIIPNHGMNGFYVEDTFPNMIAEAGVDQQPNYLAPLDPAADCPAQDMLQWNLPPTGYQNGIEYTVIPKCFQPGVAWIIQVDTHLETDDAADLHCNLQIGSGADIYLGPMDEFIAEYKVNALKANPKANSWANIPKGYWTTTPVLFTAAETALVEPGSPVYVSCFMTPVDAVFNKRVPGGWKILDREFYLAMQFCEDGALNDLDGDGAEDVPTDYDLDGDGTVDGEMAQPNPNYVDLNGDGIAAEQDHNADLIPDMDLNKDGIVDDLDGNGVPEIIPPVIYGPEGDAVVPPGAIPGGGVALPPGVEVGEDGDIFIDADADGVDDRYDGVFVDDNDNGLDDAEEAAAAAEAAAEVPDVTVGPVDANNDGVDDADEYIDLDNNGVDDNLEEPDVTEAAVSEGPVSATYVDANNDGINDADELPDASVTGSESESGSETGFVDNNFNGINDADEGLRHLL